MKFGKYTIVDKIASGGMAEVFRAKITGEKGFEKLLVIKKVLPHLAAEEKWIMHFIDEAKLAALLQHENIIHIYDFGKIDDSWYLAMEYLSGRDLKGVVDKSVNENKQLTIENSLQIALKICEGLDYAHRLKDLKGTPLNIIHRDISPQNIFITFDGKVKIIDFGIAKAAERSVHTQTGMIKGKLAYMSPEQAGGRSIDHRSDIFAVGVILYELITGRRMYTGEVSEILLKVVQAEFEPAEEILENYPAKLFEILNKALTKEPEDRYQSAGDMASDIEDCMFELKYRAGSRKLAAYMKTLFEGEYTTEKYESVDTLDYTSAETKEDDQDIVKTAVLSGGGGHGADETESSARIGNKIKEITSAAAETLSPLKKVPTLVQEWCAETGKWLKKQGVPTRKGLFAAGMAILFVVALVSGILLKRDRDQKVAELLSAARMSFEEDHLTEPPEACAYYYYKEVLEIDGDNEEAENGVQEIVQRKIELAKLVLSRFRHDAALAYINSGLSIDPENPELLELKELAEKNVSNRIFGKFKTIFKSEEEEK